MDVPSRNGVQERRRGGGRDCGERIFSDGRDREITSHSSCRMGVVVEGMVKKKMAEKDIPSGEGGGGGRESETAGVDN